MPDPTAAGLREHFFEGLSHVPLSMSIVTAAGSDGAFGQLTAGFCPVPAEGPSLVVCLDGDGSTAAAVRDSAGFRLNVSDLEHERLADDLTGGARLDDLAAGTWETDEPAGPRLRRAVVSFACRLTELRAVAGRVALFGEVLDTTWRDDAEPLLRLHHRYRRVEELPLPMFPGIAPAPQERTTSAR